MTSTYAALIAPYYHAIQEEFTSKELYWEVCMGHPGDELFAQMPYHNGNDNLLYHNVRAFVSNLVKQNLVTKIAPGTYKKTV